MLLGFGATDVLKLGGNLPSVRGHNPLGGAGPKTVNATVTITATGSKFPGSLTRIKASTDYTFTPDPALGSRVDTSSGATITFDDYEACRDGISMIWAGRNNVKSPLRIVDDVLRIIERKNRKFLVLGVPTFPTGAGAPDEADINRCNTLNDMLRSAVGGDHFVDVWAMLRDHGFYMQGLTANADDLTDIAAGLIPRSLRLAAGDGHLNIDGYQAVATLCTWRIRALGFAAMGDSP